MHGDSKAWLARGWGVGGEGAGPPGGVGSMVWLGLALHPRTGDRMHLDGI